MDKLVVGILAHVDAGKTTLSEGLLYTCGRLKKLGRVDHQDAFLDTDPMERARGITIFSKQAVLPVDGAELTLLDTPGHADFSSEMERTLQVLDCAILVISGTDGVQGHTHTLWRLLERYGVPTFLFVNKMDLAGADKAALLAGLMTAKERCDMAISMDADLQDDIDAVDAMVEQYYAGCDVVYGVRSSRKKDTFFKRFTAEGFYRVMNFMGAETVFNHADYRLMSRRALEGLAQFREVNLFLRGIVPMIGYRTGTVEYERGERFAGESKYPLKKMLSFAMEGITSLSVKPIRYITGLGFLIFAVSILMLIYSIVRWATGATIIGWASVICSVWAIGGLILLSLGVIGEYIGKIYLETKGRPRFLLREVLEDAHGEKAD